MSLAVLEEADEEWDKGRAECHTKGSENYAACYWLKSTQDLPDLSCLFWYNHSAPNWATLSSKDTIFYVRI